MNVLLINGGPHPHGCTFTALSAIASALREEDIDSEIFFIGNKPVRGCIDCRKCVETGYCIFDDDPCNRLIDKMKAADGIVFGSPVHYAKATGVLLALLDRVFYQKHAHFRLKPAACIVSSRRAGTTAALDSLNKYPLCAEMLLVGSQYWPMVHGAKAEDVPQDEEGYQTMQILGRNMAWVLKSLEAAKSSVPRPPQVAKKRTNFIRV